MDRPLLKVHELPAPAVTGDLRSHVAGASGIVRVGSWLHVVSDDDHHVLSWRVPIETPATATRFIDGDLPADAAARKAAKPDIEALTTLRHAGRMWLTGFGSGSTERRRGGFAFELDGDGEITGAPITFDLGAVYDRLATHTGPPNVEGATQVQKEVFLLLRSSTGSNRVARLDSARLVTGIVEGSVANDALTSIVSCELGNLDGVPLGFTDAVSVGAHVWFSAAAEDTPNAYDDGEVGGSVVGRLTTDCTAVDRMWMVDLPGAKVEGVTRMSADGEPLRMWLVTDQDDEARPSQLLECAISGG